LRPGVDLEELQVLIEELEKFTNTVNSRWFGKIKLTTEDIVYLKVLLNQISEGQETVKKYKTQLEESVYDRVNDQAPPKQRVVKGRDLRGLANWPLV